MEGLCRKDYREYDMLRTEILQYLEEYQTVRNMMYAVTVSILSAAGLIGGSGKAYICLLPLVVILPSYVVLYDYMKCVSVASTYLRVFYELDSEGNELPESPYHWESRHYAFGEKINDRRADMPAQQLPYIACGAVCLGLFWWKKLFCLLPDRLGCVMPHDIFCGIIATLLSIFVFVRFRKVSQIRHQEVWEKIKKDRAGMDLLHRSL